MARQAQRTRKRVSEGVWKRTGKQGDRYLLPIYNPRTRKTRWHTLPAGTTLRDAKRERSRLMDEIRSEPSKTDETVRQFADKWADRFPHRKPSTIRHNTERVKLFVKEFGDARMGTITRQEARDWALEHPAHLPAVSAMFSDAVEYGTIPHSPFRALKIGRTKGRQHIQVLTAREVDELAATARRILGEYGQHFSDLILTAAWTGLRPGEMFALIPDRVDLEAGVVHVLESADNKTRRLDVTKTNAGRRTIPLLDPARKPLSRAMEHRDAGEFVFQPPFARDRFHRHGKASFGGANFSYWWNPVRDAFTDRLGETHWLRQRIERDGRRGRLSLYEMRHTAATRLAERGAQPYDLAAFLGHSDGGGLAMRVYGHLSPQDSHERIRRAFAA